MPQGSILGPVLYIIYNNDIPKSKKTKLAIFADDTAICAHSWKKRTAAYYIESHAEKLNDHFRNEKTKINAGKTECIIFSRKIKEQDPETIEAFDVAIKPSKNVKYLGVILDKKLSFNDHITHAINKVNKSIGALIPILGYKSKMSVKNKLLVYKMIIRPALLYATPVWGGMISKTQIERLQKIQNKCLRMAMGAPKDTKITKLHETTQVHYIEDIINEQCSNFYANIDIESIKHLSNLSKDDIPYHIKFKLPQLNFINKS